MDLFLVRHGQSEANAGLNKDLDSPISRLGQQQSELTAQRLKSESITRAYVSPLLRTLQTIEPICEALDVRAAVYPAACEYFSYRHPEYLAFTGLSVQVIRNRFPMVDIEPEIPCESPWWPTRCEDPEIAFARTVTIRNSLLARFGATQENILIVSHSDTIGWLIQACMRVPSDPNNPPWSENCAITHLRIPADPTAPATVIVQNDSRHLAPLSAYAS